MESLIFPHFDFACAVYHSLDDRELKLERILKACVRFVYECIRRKDHVTLYRLQLGLLCAKSRRQYMIGSLAFQSLKNVDIFVRSLPRLQPTLLYYSGTRTKARNSSFTYIVSRILNSVSPIVFNSDVHYKFKQFLFQHLLNQYKENWDRRVAKENMRL